MRKIWIIFLSFFLIGCSEKASNLILKSNVNPINIAKSGNFLFYAYLEDGEELTRISISKLPIDEDKNEEIVRVYENGYYPIYDIPRDSKICGKHFDGTKIKAKKIGSYAFCHSNYIKTASIGGEILGRALMGVVSLGIYPIMYGTVVHKDFNRELFQQSIIKSRLSKIKNLILYRPNILKNSYLSATYLFEMDKKRNRFVST